MISIDLVAAHVRAELREVLRELNGPPIYSGDRYVALRRRAQELGTMLRISTQFVSKIIKEKGKTHA